MNNWMRTALVGFIAGALSVLIFHQLGFWIANELGLARAGIYNMRGVPPWGVPAIMSQTAPSGAFNAAGLVLSTTTGFVP